MLKRTIGFLLLNALLISGHGFSASAQDDFFISFQILEKYVKTW